MSSTSIFMLVVFGGIALAITIFDIYIIAKKGKQESISAYMIRAFRKFPALTFMVGLCFGYLSGHLTWSMDTFDWMHKEDLKKRCETLLKESSDAR